MTARGITGKDSPCPTRRASIGVQPTMEIRMVKHANKTYTKETITLDGNVYNHCEFQECKMVYSGGTLPNLSNSHFNGCSWTFDDAAARTISLMTALYAGGAGGLIEGTFENIRGKQKPGITLH